MKMGISDELFGVLCFFFLMIRRPPRSTQSRSSAASDVYKRQEQGLIYGEGERQVFPYEPVVMADGIVEQPGSHAVCLLYTSPSPRDRTRSRMPSSA